MSERAGKLRAVVSEKLGEAEGRYRDLDDLMTSDEMLRAIVQELGITRENVYTLDEIAHCADLTSNAARDVHAIVERLATLLDAAEVGP